MSDEEVEEWFATVNKIREARIEASRATPQHVEERKAALVATGRLRSIIDGQKKFLTKA